MCNYIHTQQIDVHQSNKKTNIKQKKRTKINKKSKTIPLQQKKSI